MGKHSNLKIQKLLTRSSFDFIESYLTANPVKAKKMRLELAKQNLKKIAFSELLVPAVEAIEVLPSHFKKAYVNLAGHMLIGIRHEDFWSDIVHDLHVITDGAANQEALAAWGLCLPKFDEQAIKTFCYSSLQHIARQPAPSRIHAFVKTLKQKSADEIFYDAIPTHLIASSAIAQDGVIYRHGSLILFYQKFTDEGIEELWLVKKRADGIYTTSAEARDSTLRISDVKAMRHFISNYNGQFFKGGLCPGREKQAARVCRAVGLNVNDTHAWIGDPAWEPSKSIN